VGHFLAPSFDISEPRIRPYHYHYRDAVGTRR